MCYLSPKQMTDVMISHKEKSPSGSPDRLQEKHYFLRKRLISRWTLSSSSSLTGPSAIISETAVFAIVIACSYLEKYGMETADDMIS